MKDPSESFSAEAHAIPSAYRCFGRSHRCVVAAGVLATLYHWEPADCPSSPASLHMADAYPFYDPRGTAPVVSVGVRSWTVTHRLPEGMIGGAPVVVVDKWTCAVVHSSMTQ
jgi:hypothetical protein